MQATVEREVQVTPASGKKPLIVARLNDWLYLEMSIHRMICAWGGYFPEWQDKMAVCRHIWEQSECVRRLRERLVQFPGTASNTQMPVSANLEQLVNTVLLAPQHQDAVDGIYQILSGALVKSYLGYVERAHPVHDAPTIAMIQEIVRIKEQQRLWLRGYRRRHPHSVDRKYSSAIKTQIETCNDLAEAIPVMAGEIAVPVGVNTSFLLPNAAAKSGALMKRLDIMPEIERDFVQSIEARRLFWCYGYMLEQNLADSQMRWIWAAHDMPWEFQQDISRHLWDESRHGDSGYSRLLDFGITPELFGISACEQTAEAAAEVVPPGPGVAAMTPRELYDAVFMIGMCAETGHFLVKHEAYADFKDGGDLESAEMVLFDIIDETSHVQYAHHWLPMLAERAGADPDEFKERGRTERDRLQRNADERLQKLSETPVNKDSRAYLYYQELLAIMRAKQPLSNANTCPPRSFKPM